MGALHQGLAEVRVGGGEFQVVVLQLGADFHRPAFGGGRFVRGPPPAAQVVPQGGFARAEQAGEAYEGSGYVVVDELGRPFKTDKLRREAQKLMEEAGVRRVRLYDARHACLSWMANNGVPDTVVSAWAGHSDLSFTKRVYVHPDPQSLKAGSEKLSELLG